MATTKLLVVVDKSLASMRAVKYVAQILGGRRGFRICLAHTLPSPPAEMMEYRRDRRILGRKNGWRPAFAPAAIFGQQLRRERRRSLSNMPMQNCATRDLRAERSKLFLRSERQRKRTQRDPRVGATSADATRLSSGEGRSPGFANSFRTNPADELVRLGKGFPPGWWHSNFNHENGEIAQLRNTRRSQEG